MKRDLIYQFVLLAIIACTGYIIISATQSNLERLGVEFGFDFLFKRAGFEIGQTLIAYDANSTIARALIVALLNTLMLAFVSIICASILGLIIGVSRLSSNWLVAQLATVYVEIFRNIPSLLQIFFWYFVVLRFLPGKNNSLVFLDLFYINNRGFFFPAPVLENTGAGILSGIVMGLALFFVIKFRANRKGSVTGKNFPGVTVYALLITVLLTMVALVSGLTWEVPQAGRFSYEGGFVCMPEFIALVIGLSMYNATYIGEIVRSSFKSVSTGQTEAAESLGLSRYQTLRLVIFPQALRVMLPPLTTVYLNLFKSTSLAAAIAYPEVISVFVGTVNNLVGQPVIIMTLTLVVYAFVSLCIAVFLNWYNRRIALTTGNPL